MSAYSLTHAEAWILCTLLHLPVQPGSAMAGWLNSAKPAVSPAMLDKSVAGLQKKGYYDPTKTEQPYLEGFLASMMLTCMNAAELTALIRRNGQANLTRFAQVGIGLVQFGMDETNLTFQDVEKMDEIAGTFLPEWFTVSQKEDLRAELVLGEFLLFKQAGIQADLALVDSGFKEGVFKKSSLMKQFNVDQRWVNIFSAEGLRGVLSVDEMPLEDYFNQLCGRGYLEESGPDELRIGAKGQPLAAALADPDLCSLSVSMEEWEGRYPQAGVFLYGAGRLLLAELKPGLLIFQQLSGLEQGQAWVKKLLMDGSQVHYISYTIPTAPMSRSEQAAAIPASDNSAAGATVFVSRKASIEIIVLGGELENKRFPVGDQLRLGREADNDLILPDKMTSRHHAILQRQDDVYRIIDLNSGNGTYVNGKRITDPTELKNGDIVLIGDTKLTISDRP